MSIDDLRKRLSRLNRSPLPVRESDDDNASMTGNSSSAPDADLMTLVSGHVEETPEGEHFLTVRSVAGAWEGGTDVSSKLLTAARSADAFDTASAIHGSFGAAIEHGLDRMLFMDIETCGFAGTPLFLIGVMYYRDGVLRVDQCLARSYCEERAVVATFGKLLSQKPYLITFNGKSFDWPFIQDRAAVTRVELPPPIGHCDLLHVSRRRYRDTLPNCKLQTLERFVCGRHRRGDIAGGDIPAAYHAFVSSGVAWTIRDVMHHNYLDLVTLAEIMLHLLMDRRAKS
jgi:uncharacterized protein